MSSDAAANMAISQGLLNERLGPSAESTPIEAALKKRRIKTMADKGIAPDEVDSAGLGQPSIDPGMDK